MEGFLFVLTQTGEVFKWPLSSLESAVTAKSGKTLTGEAVVPRTSTWGHVYGLMAVGYGWVAAAARGQNVVNIHSGTCVK